MRVGTVREIKNHEYRVGLTPESARELVAHGHEVWVETGAGLGIPPGRLQAMTRAVEQIYPGLCSFEETHPWAGLRPATPDSVPIIRAARGAANVILNVGHGALGFTLAAGSARRVGALLPGGVPLQEG